MMDGTPFQTFIALIDFDQTISGLEDRLKQSQRELFSLQDQEQELRKSQDIVANAVYDAQKAVDLKELDMLDLDQAMQKKKQQLESAASTKEYQSLKLEIDRYQLRENSLEQDLLAAWRHLDTVKAIYKETKETMEQKINALNVSIDQLSSQITSLADAIDEKLVARPSKIQNVPAEWLEKYAVMRSNVPDPVVPVVNGSCSACFYNIINHDLQQLRRNKLLQCKDCYRFLYLKDSDAQNDALQGSST
ncbi:MAG TPA: hypothetical protein VGT41_05040 [Candidatus Babeliales bacterium]|nr:hypothetical protein [Candidatus Babeliales bacterium]